MQCIAFKVFSAIIWLLVMSTQAFAACGKVDIAEMNWVSARVVTAVAKFMMEKGYNCDVTVVPTTTTDVLKSIKEKGKPDLVTELWVKSAPGYDKLVADGKVRSLADILSDGGVEGWWIPKYLADQYPELRSLDGILARPELVGGRLFSCPKGWGCRVINENLAAAHGLKAKGIEVVYPKSGQSLAASISDAFAKKTPWFGYYWAPTPVIGKFPMVKVDIGTFDENVHACNKRQDCKEPGKSAYPRSRVITFATEEFSMRAPEIVALMERMSFTNNQMGRVLAWQAARKASADEAAVFFLQNFGPVWHEWVPEVEREKITGALRPSQ